MNLIVGLFLSVNFTEENSFWLLTELAERIVPGYWVSVSKKIKMNANVVNCVIYIIDL